MRVYLPATSELLRGLVDNGVLGPAPLTAFAVTPALRKYYRDDDIEELEYAASADAARASLRLIDADPRAVRRRVVIAADVEDRLVTVRDDLDRGVVQIGAEVPLARCASVHIDEQEAEATVAEAARSVDAADLGDPVAEEKVDDAEGFDLLWYATQEIAELLTELAAAGPDGSPGYLDG